MENNTFSEISEYIKNSDDEYLSKSHLQDYLSLKAKLKKWKYYKKIFMSSLNKNEPTKQRNNISR